MQRAKMLLLIKFTNRCEWRVNCQSY